MVKRIYYCSDWHTGAAGCDHALLERQLNHILNDDDGYVILGGDLLEAIKKADRRHDSAAVHERFRADGRNIIGKQYAYDRRLVEDLANEHKILACMVGNHERTYALHDDFDVTAQLCEEEQFSENVPYGGYSCVIVLTFDRKGQKRRVLLHCHHGKRGGTTKGGKANALDNQERNVEGMDIYFRGHGHQKILIPDSSVSVGFDEDGWPFERQRKIAKGSSGAYLKILEEGSTSYAEEAELKPTDLGCIFAEIRPFHYTQVHGKPGTELAIELRDLVL